MKVYLSQPPRAGLLDDWFRERFESDFEALTTDATSDARFGFSAEVLEHRCGDDAKVDHLTALTRRTHGEALTPYGRGNLHILVDALGRAWDVHFDPTHRSLLGPVPFNATFSALEPLPPESHGLLAELLAAPREQLEVWKREVRDTSGAFTGYPPPHVTPVAAGVAFPFYYEVTIHRALEPWLPPSQRAQRWTAVVAGLAAGLGVELLVHHRALVMDRKTPDGIDLKVCALRVGPGGCSVATLKAPTLRRGSAGRGGEP